MGEYSSIKDYSYDDIINNNSAICAIIDGDIIINYNSINDLLFLKSFIDDCLKDYELFFDYFGDE